MEVSPLIQYTVECDLLVSAVSRRAAQRIVGNRKDSNLYGKCSSIVSEATSGCFVFFLPHNDDNPLGIKQKERKKNIKEEYIKYHENMSV